MDSKKEIKNLLTIGTSQFISQIIYGLFWLYFALILSKSDYGELGFLMSIANVAVVVSVLGLTSTVLVYEAKKENIFPASFILVLIATGVTAIATFLLYENFAVSVLVMGQSVFALAIHGINSKKRYTALSWYRILRAVASIIISLILYQYIGITGILLGYFIATLFIVKEISSLIGGRKIEFSLLKPKIKFTFYSFLTRLSSVFFFWGDKAIIGVLYGFSFLASYQVAGQYLLLLEGIPRTIIQYLVPLESEGKKNKKIKFFVILVSIIIVLISVTVTPIAISTFLHQYEDAILPIQILSLSLIPLTISAIQISEFMGKENSRVVLIGGILQSGLYLILIVLLGNPFGLVGISIGLLVSTIIRTIYNFVTKRRSH